MTRSTVMTMMAAACTTVLFSACVTERTVTDGSGNLIYQEPEIHTPFESEAKKQREVEEATRELGW